MSKVEEAKKEVSNLHETLARTKAEHATAVDELIKARKTEINALQDEVTFFASRRQYVLVKSCFVF